MYLPREHRSEVGAFDYETTGLCPWSDEIKGVSFANDRLPQGVYFCMKGGSAAHHLDLMGRLVTRKKIAHNICFEMTMEEMWFRNHIGSSYEDFSKPTNYAGCTQALLNQLEGECFSDDNKLKNLQVSALGWDAKGDVELDQWLIDNDYVVESGKKKGQALKGEMWRAPTPILGHYGGLDAQSTWMLWKYFYGPTLRDFPELAFQHDRDFVNLAKLIVEQRLRGMQLDAEGLKKYITQLEWMIETLEYNFLYQSPAAPHIKRYNDDIVQAHLDKEPPEFNKPTKKNQNGAPSARHAKWKAKSVDILEKNHFNTNSKDQLGWVFYDCLFKTSKRTETNWRHEQVIKLDIQVPGETVSIDCTPTGKRVVDKEILPRLGEAGEVLLEYNKRVKELGYVRGMFESLTPDGIHHTQLRIEGAKTGRCAGTGGVNVQQFPKTPDYIKCFIPREGHTIVQMDVNSLEPVVLAELSECKAYMKILGPDAPEGNDTYLYVGSGLGEIARPILEAGYDPNNPIKSIVKVVKKKFKGLRAVFKKVHLSSQYGAGAGRVYRDLKLAKVTVDGKEVSLAQCKDMHKNYWILFEDVKAYTEGLLNQVKAVGYFIDGLGEPVVVADKFEKDILNRAIQRVGHRILMKWLYHFETLRHKRGLICYPTQCNYHDETIWECPIDQRDSVMKAMEDTWELLNAELGAIIPLAGDPESGDDWRFIKCEDPRCMV